MYLDIILNLSHLIRYLFTIEIFRYDICFIVCVTGDCSIYSFLDCTYIHVSVHRQLTYLRFLKHLNDERNVGDVKGFALDRVNLSK